MRIVQVSTFQTGGAAKACQRLNQALNNNGVVSNMLVLYKTQNHPHVIDFRDSLSFWKYYYTKFMNKLNLVKQERFRQKHELKELFSSPETIWRIDRHPLIQEADIIHLHWVAGFLNYSSFFENVKNPVVWTLHDFEPFSAGFHYPQVKPLPEEEANLDCKRIGLAGQQIHVVTPSKYLHGHSSASDLFGNYPHSVISNTFPRTPYKYHTQKKVRQKFGIESKKPILLFASEGLDYPRKGFWLLKQIMKNLQEEVDIMIVGGMDSGARYNFPFQENEKDLAGLLACADLLIFPSLVENSSNLIVESLLCGTPVVAFDAGGNSELLNIENSILCQKVTDLQSGIDLALARNWDRAKIALLSRERFVTNANSVKKYISLYNSVITDT